MMITFSSGRSTFTSEIQMGAKQFKYIAGDIRIIWSMYMYKQGFLKVKVFSMFYYVLIFLNSLLHLTIFCLSTELIT